MYRLPAYIVWLYAIQLNYGDFKTIFFLLSVVCLKKENYICRFYYFRGELGALGDIILYGCAEWIECRDLTFRNFNSSLKISYGPLKFPNVCIGKACICKVSSHAHIHLTTLTQFGQNCSIGSLLALYGSTKHPAQLCHGYFSV